jgi:predicted metalloprotease with PDZ domain
MKNFFYSLFFSLGISLSFLINSTHASEAKISYEVSMPFPPNHLFEVSVTVQNYSSYPDDFIDFTLPSWRSGRYVILNPSSGIQEFSAEDETGNKLRWSKTDKDTWRVNSSAGNTYKINYKVFSNEFSIRTRGLNDECGFIDASAVLMFAEKLRFSPLELKIIPYNGWHVTTGLDKMNGLENTFSARDYDYLADCPILIGNQKDYEFFVNEKKFTVSFPAEIKYDADTVVNEIRNISKEICDFWGDIPFEHFTYLLILSQYDYGATEHLNSTVFNVSPVTFSNKDRYNTFISNIAHEFFHTWNVKQLRPKGIDPYDFNKENYTSELWIAEGITSYYQNIFMIRAGYMTPEKYFEILGGNIQNDIERPGNYIQSLAESSFDAWVKYNNNTPNKWISESDFYSKGANLGLFIDLEIRNSSDNEYSLDDVMKTMYKNFPLNKGGYTNEDFIKVCEEYNGSSMKNFFDKYLYGVDTLDWKKYLNYAGLDLITSYDPSKPGLGISTRESGEKLIISYVVPGSASYDAGLDNNDEIIALNGYRVRSSSLSSRISDMREGDEVKLTIMREDKLREFTITLKEIKSAKYKVEKIKEPDNLQKRIFNGWLNVAW